MTVRRRIRALGATLVVVGLVATGCSDDPAHPKPLPSKSSTPTGGTAGTPSSPSSGAAPDLPPGAMGEGSRASTEFARYYLTLINFGQHSGNTDPMREFSFEQCSTCKAIADEIDKVYDKSGHIENGDWRATKARTVRTKASGSAHVRMAIHIEAQDVITAPGAEASTAAPTNGTLDFFLRSSTSGWKVEHLVARA
jgi:hypothetical protein